MRLVIVSQEYPPETAKGGIGTQARMKAEGLAARGHEVTVISRSTSSRREEQHHGELTVIRLAGPRLNAHTEIADWIAWSSEAAAEVLALHETAPLDLVEFPEWACEGYVHLLNRTPWYRPTTIVHLHGPLPMLAREIGWPEQDSELYRVGTQMEATCLRLADAVYSSSGCSADWCAREYGLRRADIPVLHTGVDAMLFSPREVSRDHRPTVVFVGKVTWNKGVAELVDAACTLAPEFPDLRLRLIGKAEPQVAAELLRRAEAAGAPQVLELPGFVARDDLPEALSQADVFAAPSHYEGGPGFVYLEAMACGLPVIACSGSGAAEVVSDGQTGRLVPPRDTAALAAVLRELLADADAARTMGHRAREYVSAEASSAVCLARIEEFYAAVAGTPAGDTRPTS